MKKTLIKNGIIITVNSSDTVWLNGWILICDGKIESLGEGDAPDEQPDWEIIDASHMAVVPGIVDAHTHVCGSLFKGMTEDAHNGFYGLALPLELLLTPETTYTLSLLGAAECLTAGITCVNDAYHYMHATARAIRQIGMRGVLAESIIETDLSKIQYGDYTRIPQEAEARIEDSIRLIEDFHQKGNGRITCKFSPHATDTISVELAKRIKALGDQYEVGFHTHVAQKQKEVDFLEETYHLTPVEYLIETGLMGQNLSAAHCIYITDNDVKLLAEGGCTVVHCAEMSGKRSDLMPVKKMYDAGVKISFGTDWVTMDPWTSMRTAIIVGRIGGCTLDDINARVALRKSTIEPAIHLGLGDKIGSIEAGKQADLVLIDLDKPRLRPVFDDPVSTIVYNANGADVDTVMVDGEILVRNGKLLSIDMGELLRDGQQISTELYETYKKGK